MTTKDQANTGAMDERKAKEYWIELREGFEDDPALGFRSIAAKPFSPWLHSSMIIHLREVLTPPPTSIIEPQNNIENLYSPPTPDCGEFPEAEFNANKDFNVTDGGLRWQLRNAAQWGWDRGRESVAGLETMLHARDEKVWNQRDMIQELTEKLSFLEKELAASDELRTMALNTNLQRIHELKEKLSRAEKLMGTRNWSDFERDEKRVKELEKKLAAAQRRIDEMQYFWHFGCQCWQDRCEGAFIEVSVAKKLEAENKRLTEALQYIVDTKGMSVKNNPVRVAREALKPRDQGGEG